MSGESGRNLLLALLLSLSLTLVFAVLYIFFPVISSILTSLWSGFASSQPDRNEIAAVAGGASTAFLKGLVFVAPILFFAIFVLLQKRTTSRTVRPIK